MEKKNEEIWEELEKEFGWDRDVMEEEYEIVESIYYDLIDNMDIKEDMENYNNHIHNIIQNLINKYFE